MIQGGHIKDNEKISEKNIKLFLRNKGGNVTAKQCFDWLSFSVKTKKSAANYTRLANCYDFGIGTRKNLTKAIEWYLKAAKLNDPVAQYNLSFSLYSGEGVRKNLKKSFFWLKKSATKNYPEALADFGFYYYNGIGTSKNFKKAFLYYKKASRKKVPRAYFNLGLMYLYGEGIKQNKTKSYACFKSALLLGHKKSKKFIKLLEKRK